MTEEQWDTCTEPDAMLPLVLGMERASHRKARLLACACVRLGWHLLRDSRSRAAVPAMEQRADGLGLKKDFRRAKQFAYEASRDDPEDPAARLAFQLLNY